MLHEYILDDLSKDCPCNGNGKWCFLRELIAHTGLKDRDAEQLRLIYDYKYLKSEEEGKDIGRKRAFTEFIKLYAKKFDKIYKEGMRHDELFELLFPLHKLPSDENMRGHIFNR